MFRFVKTVLLASALNLTLIVAAAAQGSSPTGQASKPCLSSPEYKQFDFWVGEWDVQPAAGQPGAGRAVASSSIQRVVDGCIIFENYWQGDGYTGKSFNFFDTHLKKWRQVWVDSRGGTSEFTGEYRDGAIHYDGESHVRGAGKVLRRMVLSSLGPDRVRQYSERSTDGGKTWSVAYDFTYVRKH